MSLNVKTLLLSQKTARYYQIPSTTSATIPAHFYGGNGFAVGVYEPLLMALSDTLVITSLAMRGEWVDKPTAPCLTREEDADLLIEFLQKTQDRPVVGIGHSQGATATAIAAAKCPALFSQLVLLEPVTFTQSQTFWYNLAPRTMKLSREPFLSTLSKQATWDSVDAYYDYLRAHRAYKRISDAHLRIYATNSLTPDASGKLALLFPPEQELANYFGTPYIIGALKQLQASQKVPYTIVMGKPTIFISEKVRHSFQKFVPAEQIVTLPEYGHLLPLEAPLECAKVIKERLSNR